MQCHDNFFWSTLTEDEDRSTEYNLLECHPLGSLMPRIESRAYILIGQGL